MTTVLREIRDFIKDFILRYYGQRENIDFIVDSTHASPSNEEYTKLQVLSDITGLSLEDKSLVSASSTYPATATAGTIYYGIFKNITVTGGSLKAFSK